MKQHKDIRKILKRSGSASTGICRVWGSAVCFVAMLFGTLAVFRFLSDADKEGLFIPLHP